MKKLTTVLALSMMSVFASAHEGEDHSQTSTASTAADCSQLQSMQAKGSMNMNDPVVQALMQKCHEQMNNLHGNMMNNGQNMMNGNSTGQAMGNMHNHDQ